MTPPPKRGFSARDLYPLLFVISPILALYSLNWGEVELTSLIRPFFLLLGIASLLWGVLYLVLRRNAQLASLLVSGCLISLFVYEQCQIIFGRVPAVTLYAAALVSNNLPTIIFSQPVKVAGSLSVWLVGTILLFILCVRVKKDLTSIAWVAGIALIFPSLWRIGNSVIRNQHATSTALAQNASVKTQEKIGTRAAGENAPDLYVIVMDAYARQDILRSMYGVDNEPFLQSLEKQGFLVARQSRANYPHTPLAVGSTLNLDYISPDLQGHLELMQPAINHNRIAALLREQGYHFVSIPTGFELTAAPSADLIYDPSKNRSFWAVPFPSLFEQLLINKTPLVEASQDVFSGFQEHREHILAAFAHLGDAAELPYSKFVFAHILSPHPPFVFDAEGRPYYPVGQPTLGLGDASDYHGSRDIYRREYGAQLHYINRRLLETMAEIKKRSHRPYVIVLMGDHGARSETSWDSLAKTDVHEAFANLFSVYASPGVMTPEKRTALEQRMSGVITPINGLRAVMTDCFGFSYPNLPDRSFYSTKWKPMQFDDITGVLDKSYGTKADVMPTQNHLPTVKR